MASVDSIKVANSKSLEDFTREYLPEFDSTSIPPSHPWTNPKTQTPHTITLHTAPSLPASDLSTCFDLLQSTSREDYQKHKSGWNPRAKLREMRLDDLKYLMVRGTAGEIQGFASLMPTWEDGHQVVYCYEIHLGDDVRSRGLGALLMGYIDTVAINITGVSKVMLTCFTRNTQAMRFYERLGFGKDDFSPGPTVLRNGTRVECAYVILSKGV